ncbi:MAG: PKD domain-containing protein, partial [Candidatus Paceibacterota bacterium]
GEWKTATATPGAVNVKNETSRNNDQGNGSGTGDGNNGDTSNDTKISAHGSGVAISETKKLKKVSVSAGRDRIALAGAPIIFGPIFGDDVSSVETESYLWTFGDGLASVDKNPSHIFSLPGEYVVVLNARVNNVPQVDRIKVKVSAADIGFSVKGEGSNAQFVISNNLKDEVNFGGWSIKSRGLSFVFPADTIVLSKGKIVLPQKTIGLFVTKNDEVSLTYPGGDVLVAVAPVVEELAAVAFVKTDSVLTENKKAEVSQIEVLKKQAETLDGLNKQLAKLQADLNKVAAKAVVKKVVAAKSVPKSFSKEKGSETELENAAAVGRVKIIPKQSTGGILSFIKNLLF